MKMRVMRSIPKGKVAMYYCYFNEEEEKEKILDRRMSSVILL